MKMSMMAACVALAVGAAATSATAQDKAPAAAKASPSVERVAFRSMDDAKTQLVGYLFKPAKVGGKTPAVVLMHGGSGAYSTSANGVQSAETLTGRHKGWARWWAEKGYYALVVDSFGPRGFPEGFSGGANKERRDSVNEVTVRPLDAYGALSFLRTLPEIDDGRIALMGWSHGASATLAAMADDKPADMRRLGYRAAVALYPSCALRKRFDKNGWRGYAPVRVFMGAADEEVSPETCSKLVERSRKLGSDIVLTLYPGAESAFDDPGKKRQSVPANARAREQAMAEATAFLADQLKR